MGCAQCSADFRRGNTMVLVMRHSFTMSSRKATLLCLDCAPGVLTRLARTARAESQYDTSAEVATPEPVAVLSQAERDATSSYRRWG